MKRPPSLPIYFSLLACASASVFCEDTQPHIIPNGDYRILDSSVNVRQEPNRGAKVLFQLNLNDEVSVLERVEKAETIEDMTAYWYKITHEKIVGFIWGGFIATTALDYDIDKNGITDHFYSRISKDSHIVYQFLDTYKDVFIYINNKRISTADLHKEKDHIYSGCEFKPEAGELQIVLYGGIDDYSYLDYFKIGVDGHIEYLRRN
jgi:hypothetical protein